MKYECHTDRFMRKLCFIYKKYISIYYVYINDVEKERKEKRKKKKKKEIKKGERKNRKAKESIIYANNNEVMYSVPAECLFYAKIMLQIGIEHFETV